MRYSLAVLAAVLLTGCAAWMPPGPERDTVAQREEAFAQWLEDAGHTTQAVSPVLPTPWNFVLLGVGAVAAGAAAAWRQSVGRHIGWEEKEEALEIEREEKVVTDLAAKEAVKP